MNVYFLMLAWKDVAIYCVCGLYGSCFQLPTCFSVFCQSCNSTLKLYYCAKTNPIRKCTFFWPKTNLNFGYYYFLLLKRHLFLADVPSEVDSYHSLFPLEPLPPPNRMQKTSNFSYITSCYKVVNSKDDLPYCLRRIHGEKHDDEKNLFLY